MIISKGKSDPVENTGKQADNNKMIKEANILDVLNCPCTIADEENYQRILCKGLSERINIITIAVNARKIVLYNENHAFREIFEKNNVLPIPDGIGATLAMRLFNKKKTKKIDFPRFMFDLCNKNNIRCYFVGTTESNNKKAVEEIKKTYPGIIISGRQSGFNLNEEKLLNDLYKSNTQVVFIAMGSPKQELLSANLAQNGLGVIFVGVGGRFDILAGEKKRAPKLIMSLGLEWAYRFFNEPSRIKQQYDIIITYFLLFINRLLHNHS